MTAPIAARRGPLARFLRNPVLWSIVGLLVLAILGSTLAVSTALVRSERSDASRQRRLAPFYEPPSGWRSAPVGALLRQAPLGTTIGDARAWRVLYRSERTDGTPTVSSGMVLAPPGDAPAGGRPVVAWAHGTVGLGDTCAPSRSRNPLGQLAWAEGMLRAGMVLTATDYAGLGTPGVERYLIGGDEARDVLNSVRAARALPTGAGARVAVYGHSQGGHAALWTGATAAAYAPELAVVGVAAGAPAAELAALVRLQDRSAVAWVIGPEVVAAWPLDDQRLDPRAIVSGSGLRFGASIGRRCILAGALEGIVLQKFGRQYFRGDPTRAPAWAAAFAAQTPPPLPASLPVLVAQGLDDTVVLPETTALLVQRWCAAGSRLTMAWLGDLGHVKTGLTAGPLATTWFQQRFSGVPAGTTCGTVDPIPAATEPT
ncbi:MAG: lipase family protein [Actinomycetes bacterium]